MPTLAIQDVSVNYAVRGGVLTALANVDLEMRGGDFVVALGASGCGKTTLLNVIAGFLAPSTGVIMLDGRAVTGPGADRGVVFQKHALMPWLSVRDNVALGLRMRGVPAAERRRIAEEKLALVGLEKFGARAIHPRGTPELGGGSRRGAATGGPPATAPAVLLRDEPMGALDAFTREQLQEILIDVWAASRKMVFFITPSVEEALFLSTRLIVMSPSPGRVTHTYDDVPFSRRFLRERNARAVKSDPAFIAMREEVLSIIHQREVPDA